MRGKAKVVKKKGKKPNQTNKHTYIHKTKNRAEEINRDR
jgi:hypothetical protein